MNKFARPLLLRKALPVLMLIVAAPFACTPAAPDGTTGPNVQAPTTFSLTVAWDPPTTDAAGGPLSDLASYRVYFGTTTPVTTTNSTMLDVGTVTTFTFEDLDPGLYYVAVTAVDSSGNESVMSQELEAEVGSE